MTTSNAYAKARINLSRLAAALLVIAMSVTASRWNQSFVLVAQVMSFIGWMLLGVGVVGRIWAGSYICSYKNVQLMTIGPYSLCRNPLYLFSFIGGVGMMMLTQTLLFPFVFAVIFLSYYQPVMRSEEHTLRNIHGDQFETYRQTVPLFWPQRLEIVEPEKYTIGARNFRKFLTEVIWFVVVGALVQVITQMHLQGNIPALYYVY